MDEKGKGRTKKSKGGKEQMMKDTSQDHGKGLGSGLKPDRHIVVETRGAEWIGYPFIGHVNKSQKGKYPQVLHVGEKVPVEYVVYYQGESLRHEVERAAAFLTHVDEVAQRLQNPFHCR